MFQRESRSWATCIFTEEKVERKVERFCLTVRTGPFLSILWKPRFRQDSIRVPASLLHDRWFDLGVHECVLALGAGHDPAWHVTNYLPQTWDALKSEKGGKAPHARPLIRISISSAASVCRESGRRVGPPRNPFVPV